MTKTKILSIILFLAATSLAAQAYSGGNGTYENPYLISSKADMEALANAVDNGTTYDSKFFRLTQNLTGANALTTSVGSDNVNPFQGVFDGNGYEIELNNAPYGVFGSIWYATIQNLGVSGTVSAYSASNNSLYAGGICGSSNYSTIIYCYNSASVSAVSTQSESYNNIYCGGICGYSNMTSITDCFNTGAISGSSYFPCFSGGIIGCSYYTSILNCYNTGDISAVSQTNSTTFTGGICGYGYGYGNEQFSIKNCFSANSSLEATYNYNGESYNSQAGRITGYTSGNSEISNNYALSTTMVNSSTLNTSDATDKDGAGTSIEDFKSQSWIQSNLGWDFNTVWQMSSGSSTNQGFPVFRSNAKPVSYNISAKSGKNGSISPVGDATVPQGGNITYTFTPNQGFQIYLILIDNVNNNVAVSSGKYTFTEVARNHTIEVVFRLISLPTFSGGEGTSTSPYLISSQADMSALADAVEGGTTYEGKFFHLTQNLTGANAVATSVGVYHEGEFYRNSFGGVFDGNGFEIELKDVEGGVFGNLYNAVVQNLGVSGKVTTPVKQTNYPVAGGVCAYARNSTIYDCWNSATVSTTGVAGNSANYIGGICGQAYDSEIMHCYNTGNISSSASLSVSCYEGGIIGFSNETQISNCFNSGQISGSGSNSVFNSGGISGSSNNSDISNCYNTGNISAISQSYYSTYAGGICGYSGNNLSIKNCFSANSSIEAKFNGGSSNSGDAGRIAGYFYNNELNNNFALSTMTVNGSAVSSPDATGRDGSETSLENFKSQQWIQNNLGWDFNTVWQMSLSTSVNQGFPVFKKHTITASSGYNGSISPSGEVLVTPGSSQEFSFTPDTGYEIEQVLVDGTNNALAISTGKYTFSNVTSNHTISVTFKLKQYTITASSSNNGSISPSGIVSVSHGSNQTFIFSPDADYLIGEVLVDGARNSLAKENGYHTFSNISSNHSIYVSFVAECISNIVVQVWDDVLSVISIPANNGGYTFIRYQWLKNNVEIQGETSGNLYLANDPESSTALYSCRIMTSDNQILQTCPISLMPGAIRAYPNPTEGTVIIESSRLEEGDMIEVYSSSGMFVKQFSANARRTEINIGDLQKGMYVIKVNGKQVKIVRL